jgi:homoserine dehydrogenase
METAGKTLEEAIHEAQWENIATGNPSQSLHGIMTRNRLVLQIATIYGLIIKPEMIKTSGISTLSCHDVEIACELGCSIRLLGLVQVDSEKVRAVVEPCMIPSVYLLAQARAGSEIIYFKTESGGSHVYSAPGTSYESQVRAILSDLEMYSAQHADTNVYKGEVEEFSDCFYLRFNMINMNDTLAAILQLFNRAGVDIEKIHQPVVEVSRETADKLRQSLVIITGKTRRSIVDSVLLQIAEQVKLAGVRACFRFLRRD